MVKAKEETISTEEVKEVSVVKSPKQQSADLLIQFMKEESRLVKGIFRCFENPGATEKISVKKYPTQAEMAARGYQGGVQPFEKFMIDGHEYEIPLYVARFLNGVDVTAGSGDSKIGTCSYVTHGFKWENGQSLPPASATGEGGIPVPIIGVAKRTRRYGFESLEFGGLS